MRRSDQRRAAVVALYQHDLTGRPVDELFEPNARPYTRGLAHATLDFQDELDEAISSHATGWSLDRIAPLELLHPELTIADTPIPPEGAIDEAVETAKRFCGADAPGFVNGVLSAILRANRDNRAAHG